MSLDRTIHLKPFIKIPIQYEHGEDEIKTCGEHRNFNNDPFCPKCGKKITTQKIPVQSELWCEELIGNQNFQHFTDESNGVMYLFSNYSHHTDIDTEENVFTTITPELINEMITHFSEYHKDDIELLEAKIGQEVKVEFGFVYDVH